MEYDNNHFIIASRSYSLHDGLFCKICLEYVVVYLPRQTDNGSRMSEIVLRWLKTRISVHWNKFMQSRWIFCNLAQYRWFCVFATEIWWFF
jgi:hypothetical protein